MEPAPATDLALDHKRHADELAETWQVKALRHTGKHRLGMVVLSVLAHNFDDAMPVLLRIAFPGFNGLTPPFLSSAGRISRSGRVIAQAVSADGQVAVLSLFDSTRHLESVFRNLADRLKLNDADRLGLFAAIGKWLVCDYRLDPTMDPKDPDARRFH